MLFFAGYVWVLNEYSFSELLPHFFASLFYAHMLVYEEFPWVLPVAWSLEIEIRFYILAPLLSIVYLVKQEYIRWGLFLGVIVASSIYNFYSAPPSLLKYIGFFAMGMLLADFYCNKVKFLSSASLCTWIAGLILASIWFVPSIFNFYGYVIKLCMMVILFYIVLTNDATRKLFSNRSLTLIGGMCYSIYLLHFAILSCLGKLIQKTLPNAGNVYLIPAYFVFFIAFILAGSAFYFLIVEKPFMRWNMRRKNLPLS
jgi:peptidoglycan/LPS O-acetylase OafA/YrhL